MDTERLEQQLTFLKEIDKMKTILRRNVIADETRRENDAEHSWHIAVMALILGEYADRDRVDLNRVLKMALIHDLVEVYAGDTFCYDAAGNETKAAREQAAADKIFGLLPPDQGPALRALWEEFDREETADALYAAAMDRLQPFLLNCATGGHTWRLGRVKKAQVLAREETIRTGAPALYGFVADLIEAQVQAGNLLPDD